MDSIIETFKKEQGCKSCISYKEKEKLIQSNKNKKIEKFHYCKLFKVELKDINPCERFRLSYEPIRKKILGG